MPVGQTTSPSSEDTKVPNGMHQAKANAITIFITFSLLFLRYWSFEATGAWNPPAVTIAVLFVISLFVQVGALVRGLRVEDNEIAVYRETIYIFRIAVYILLGTIPVSAVGFSNYFHYYSFNVSLEDLLHPERRPPANPEACPKPG
jgi:hypothetical protein